MFDLYLCVGYISIFTCVILQSLHVLYFNLYMCYISIFTCVILHLYMCYYGAPTGT